MTSISRASTEPYSVLEESDPNTPSPEHFSKIDGRLAELVAKVNAARNEITAATAGFNEEIDALASEIDDKHQQLKGEVAEKSARSQRIMRAISASLTE